jgi:uncharacterized membrane protein YkvA (DUF1232 family)
MNLHKWDLLLLITAVALLMPLFVNWASYAAPVLAVCGVCLAGALIIARTSMALMQSYEPEKVTVSQSESLEEMLSGHKYVRIGGAGLPPEPRSGLGQLLKPLVEMWETEQHALVMLVSAAYIVCPIDLIPDFIIIFGWIDDTAALVLFVKHIADCFRGEVPAMKRAIEVATQKTKERDTRKPEALDTESVRRNQQQVTAANLRSGILARK